MMKIGIKLPVMSPATSEELRNFIENAERERFDSIWVGDHIVIPEQLDASQYPYLWRYDRKMSDLFPSKWWLEAMTTCAFIAGASRRLQIGVGVLVVPMRRVVELAKQIATVDVVSGGRFIAGIGTGWCREEFDVLGAPFEDRGKRLDESVAVMRKLWSGGVVGHDSDLINFAPVHFEPKPVQEGGPPIWVGGQSSFALRRTVRLGNGWQAVELSPDDFRDSSRKLDGMLQEAGRDPRSVVRSVATRLRLGEGDLQASRDPIRACADAGCDHLVVYSTPGRSVDENIERATRLRHLVDEVLSVVR